MSKAKMLSEEKEWDKYWTKEKTKSQTIYRTVASFYRQFIIKRALDHFIEKEFKKGSNLLHAGSGTGQVDQNILDKYKITALDISRKALDLYKFYNGNKAQLIKASVFDIPAKTSSLDGIYNLGVMEHFTEKENVKILKEFFRILKPDGKIVLFWPPEFGTSVLFLNFLHFILNDVLRKNIRLHPQETYLIKSERQINYLLKQAGFKITKFYFGPLDLFTHCVIVAGKSTKH